MRLFAPKEEALRANFRPGADRDRDLDSGVSDVEEVLEGSENNGRITLGYGSSILVARLFAGFELARRRVPVGRSRGAIAVSVARRPVVTTAAEAITLA